MEPERDGLQAQLLQTERLSEDEISESSGRQLVRTAGKLLAVLAGPLLICTGTQSAGFGQSNVSLDMVATLRPLFLAADEVASTSASTPAPMPTTASFCAAEKSLPNPILEPLWLFEYWAPTQESLALHQNVLAASWFWWLTPLRYILTPFSLVLPTIFGPFVNMTAPDATAALGTADDDDRWSLWLVIFLVKACFSPVFVYCLHRLIIKQKKDQKKYQKDQKDQMDPVESVGPYGPWIITDEDIFVEARKSITSRASRHTEIERCAWLILFFLSYHVISNLYMYWLVDVSVAYQCAKLHWVMFNKWMNWLIMVLMVNTLAVYAAHRNHDIIDSSIEVILLFVPGVGGAIHVAKDWVFIWLCFSLGHREEPGVRLLIAQLIGTLSILRALTPCGPCLPDGLQLQALVASRWPIWPRPRVLENAEDYKPRQGPKGYADRMAAKVLSGTFLAADVLDWANDGPQLIMELVIFILFDLNTIAMIAFGMSVVRVIIVPECRSLIIGWVDSESDQMLREEKAKAKMLMMDEEHYSVGARVVQVIGIAIVMVVDLVFFRLMQELAHGWRSILIALLFLFRVLWMCKWQRNKNDTIKAQVKALWICGVIGLAFSSLQAAVMLLLIMDAIAAHHTMVVYDVHDMKDMKKLDLPALAPLECIPRAYWRTTVVLLLVVGELATIFALWLVGNISARMLGVFHLENCRDFDCGSTWKEHACVVLLAAHAFMTYLDLEHHGIDTIPKLMKLFFTNDIKEDGKVQEDDNYDVAWPEKEVIACVYGLGLLVIFLSALIGHFVTELLALCGAEVSSMFVAICPLFLSGYLLVGTLLKKDVKTKHDLGVALEELQKGEIWKLK